jgi:dTDP-4-dehydrorhamnose reductase
LIAQRKGFVEWIINSVKEDKPISLFNDVLFNPISIWHLAGEIKNKIIPNQIQGIYHIAGSEVCSKYRFGLLLLKELNISNNKISAGSIGQFEGRYGQSTDQTLCTDLYANTFNVSLPNILETILEIKNQYS